MIEAISALSTAFGLSGSAGLNAYLPLLVVALLARFTGLITLNPPWDLLTNGWIIALLVVLLAIEVTADKIPAVDHANDVIQTVVRPLAGAILFAASGTVIGDMHPVLAMACGVLVAGSVHVAKATFRPVVTATTAGLGNPVVSTVEDVVALVVSIMVIVVPILALLLLLLLFWWIWRFVRRRTGPSPAP